jgi:hypothetical protein
MLRVVTLQNQDVELVFPTPDVFRPVNADRSVNSSAKKIFIALARHPTYHFLPLPADGTFTVLCGYAVDHVASH